MNDQLDYLNTLKKVTRSHEDYRGLMAIPGGTCFAILGVKLMFATFDPDVVNHPSLFDKTGNVYWDIAGNIALLMLVALVPIHYWYNSKVGSVVADRQTTIHRLFFGITATGIAIGALAFDYIPVAPVSLFGVAASIFWLWVLSFYPGLRAWFIFFFLMQLLAVIAGPVVFFERKADTLDYMRHVVGLCFLVFGCLMTVSGILTHNRLMRELRKAGNREKAMEHD